MSNRLIPHQHLIQRAIIQHLRNNSALMASVGGNPQKIRESQYQDFNKVGYPLVVLDLTTIELEGNGTDRRHLSKVYFSVQIFSETNSSYECSLVSGNVFNALFNSQINGNDENNNPYFRLMRVDYLSRQGIVRISQRLWNDELFFISSIHRI